MEEEGRKIHPWIGEFMIQEEGSTCVSELIGCTGRSLLEEGREGRFYSTEKKLLA